MSKVLVFGAGGRAGRAAVEEARRRGHEVTAAVRNPSKYADLDAVAGDVTDAARVAELAAGHDAVVAAVYDGGGDPAVFFPTAAGALVDGLTKAGVPRLVWVGLTPLLPTVVGTLLMDTPGYPQDYRVFFLAHAAAADVFASSELDWVSIAPAGDFDHEHPERTGGYRVVPAAADSRISYADLAIALIDEVDAPDDRRQHRTQYGVAPA
ncbi:NAD(P)-dependent oxidoreductase [Kribbella sancticallisti]|uniref:NAD(P)-dependent oxidoreductase n=1 Tax=Kribbella sancticallisti TaxID=460087 RepID=A0ABP4PUD0_9ACTN